MMVYGRYNTVGSTKRIAPDRVPAAFIVRIELANITTFSCCLINYHLWKKKQTLSFTISTL